MIEVTNLTKKYGSHVAVNNISFTANKGEILGFLGPNGAGKSTTMNMLTGYLSCTNGTVKINDIDILEDPLSAKKNIGYLPEIPPLYMDMVVKDYLTFVAKLKKVKRQEIADHISDILNKTRLDHVKGRLIKNLSKGYRQRVGLAASLIGSPEVLILDEPTVGLDPKQIIEMRNLIKDLSKDHTIILSSHILSEISAICNYIMIINKGEMVALDTPDHLKELFSNKTHTVIRVRSVADDFINALKTIPGISAVEVQTSPEEGTYNISIESKKEIDVREGIFNLCYEMYNPLLMMQSTDLSLEDIFLQVTKNDPESPAPEDAKKKDDVKKDVKAEDSSEKEVNTNADHIQ